MIDGTEWIDAKTKPEDEGEYLTICKNGNYFLVIISYFNLYEKNDWLPNGYDEIIAWMPIPKLPEEYQS